MGKQMARSYESHRLGLGHRNFQALVLPTEMSPERVCFGIGSGSFVIKGAALLFTNYTMLYRIGYFLSLEYDMIFECIFTAAGKITIL